MRTLTNPESRTVAAACQKAGEETSILLFAAQPLALEVAQALGRALTPHVVIVETPALCLEALHRESFDLIVMEETVASLSPGAAEALYEAAGTSVTVEVNFGLMQAERIVLAARSALHRRRLDMRQAQAAAKAALGHELTAALTGLLLESQLALRQVGPGQVPALDRLVGLAEHVCAQLRADDDRSV